MDSRKRRIALFGNFGRANYGNESTLLAMLSYLRNVVPDAEFNCICTGPEAVAADYHIIAWLSRDYVVRPWKNANRLAKLGRRVVVGLPSEIYRWIQGIKRLWGADALIMPGTGLVTDAYTLLGWGPYDMFRWSVAAKLCRCKLLFVSVGAGPIYSRTAKFFVKAALSLADFRSYRDESSRQYLQNIGFRADNDPVYPDLVFSLPNHARLHGRPTDGRRLVVGLGLMQYAGRYSVERPTHAIYQAYLETCVEFVKWSLDADLDVRLLIGDSADNAVTKELNSLLKERGVRPGAGRIIDEPINSVDDLLSQLGKTDFVVATRFHNVLMSLLLDKPVIAISFHHKCSSLMSQMGLSKYSLDINSLKAENLIERFRELQENGECLRRTINEKVTKCCAALEEQSRAISKALQLG